MAFMSSSDRAANLSSLCYRHGGECESIIICSRGVSMCFLQRKDTLLAHERTPRPVIDSKKLPLRDSPRGPHRQALSLEPCIS